MEKHIELFNALKESNLTISSVESLTGGLFAEMMTSIPGASSVFKGAIVTYMTEEKIRLLGICKDFVDKYGVVSSEIAYLMAKNGKEKMVSDITVSFTGNAGPDVMENKPCGLVYIGIAYLDEVKTFECHFNGDRQEIRKQCIQTASELILKHILKKN